MYLSDQQEWIHCLDSNLFYLYNTKQASTGSMSPMMMDMVKAPIEAQVGGNREEPGSHLRI